MTRGVAYLVQRRISGSIRSAPERKRGMAPEPPAKRALLRRQAIVGVTGSSSRSHSIVFAARPARAIVTGRARTKAAVLLLA
jgi:hypothetical protein